MMKQVNNLKWYHDEKNQIYFSLDFKIMLTKHQLTLVLISKRHWYILTGILLTHY